MQEYKIRSAFKSGGVLIEPPGRWTPPNQAEADRLVAAECLEPVGPKHKALTVVVDVHGPPPDATQAAATLAGAVGEELAEFAGQGGQENTDPDPPSPEASEEQVEAEDPVPPSKKGGGRRKR